MEVSTIAVIGAGAIGREIACVAMCAGYRTVLEDFSAATLEDGAAHIRKTLEDGVARGDLAIERHRAALRNLFQARRVEDACREADLLIETSAEEMEAKLEIFTLFDKFAVPSAILASGSASFAISELAEITCRAEKCVGLRFSPLPRIQRLEIVRTPETSDATVQACLEAGRRMVKAVTVVREGARSRAQSGR